MACLYKAACPYQYRNGLTHSFPTRRSSDLILRSRTRIDEETVIAAIKNYADLKNKDLNKLSEYAKQFKVEKTLKRYLEVLLCVQKQSA